MTVFRTLQKLTAADLLDLQRLTEAWESYPVFWTSNGVAPAIGNGLLEGRKQIVGKWRRNYIKMVAGSTTTFGTGNYFWNLSDSPRVGYYVGSMYIEDSGTTGRSAIVIATAASTVAQAVTSADTFVSATVPQTWANGDVMACLIDYEVS